MSTTEPAPLPSQKDPTILIDPDSQWFVQSNKEYKPNSWYSSPDGSYEKILSKESILDKFSGINYKNYQFNQVNIILLLMYQMLNMNGMKKNIGNLRLY